MSILKFLGLKQEEPAAGTAAGVAGSSADTETVRKIVDALDRLDPERARFIATFAYNLSRVAHADSHISPEETHAMEKLVIEQEGLPEEQAILIVQIAKTQTKIFGGTENYLVTREFNKIATREQKLGLLRCLFAISSADESISVAEDNEVRRISKELLLEHREFIEARSAYRDYLAVLKKPHKPRS